MEVSKLASKNISAICRQISARLMDSVEASYQLDGISDKQGLTDAFTQARMKYWLQIGEVWVIGDNEGMLAGHYRRNENVLASILASLTSLINMRKTLSKEDRARLNSNLKGSAGAENFTWRKKMLKKQDYYYIEMSTIDRALKGSGAFRQLIEPIIDRMQHENIPLLLDTHDKCNVPIYQHFGFELVFEHRSKHNPDLVQYSMIKRPNVH